MLLATFPVQHNRQGKSKIQPIAAIWDRSPSHLRSTQKQSVRVFRCLARRREYP